MTSSSSVILKTEGGWYYTTTFDDPIFSDILAPYLELDERPGDVILKGSVAEVIEENWHWWLSAKEIIEDDDLVAHFTIKYSPSVTQFATILNLPPEWKLFLAVEPRDLPYDNLVRHYEEVGDMMKRHDLPIIDSFDNATNDFFKGLAAYCNTSRSRSLLCGIARIASLRSSRGQELCALSIVDWDTFLNEIESEELEYKDVIINSINVIQGRGDVRGMAIYMHVGLYSRIIANIHEYSSISLEEYGLGFLIGEDDTCTVEILNVVARSHQEIVNLRTPNYYFVGMDRYVSVDMDKFYELSERFMQSIGMEGMRVMSEILRHHTSRSDYSPSHQRRITVFLAFVEDQMEKNAHLNDGCQY